MLSATLVSIQTQTESETQIYKTTDLINETVKLKPTPTTITNSTYSINETVANVNEGISYNY